MAAAASLRYHRVDATGQGRTARALASPDMTPHAGFWIVVSFMALAEVAIIVTALRMRVRRDSSRGIVGSRAAEVVWTLLPAGLIGLLVVMSYGAA